MTCPLPGGSLQHAQPTPRWPELSARAVHVSRQAEHTAGVQTGLNKHSLTETANKVMSAEAKAQELGVSLESLEPGYLNLCIRSGNQLITSGHTSDLKGVLGKDVSVEQGYDAAKDCAKKILRSVHNAHGTLDGLRVIKVLGCVYSAPDFTDQHLVINGCSDLLHEIFGKDGDGYHARSALGFAALPTGAAVEVEAVFEVQGGTQADAG